MPYSKAHVCLLVLLVITVVAFWPSYFGSLGDASMAHHWHGVTATLWMVLIGVQSWSVHHGQRNLHRRLGRLLFVLVPLMTAAFALVTWVGAVKSVGQHPFYVQVGQPLLVFDVLLLFTTPLQVYLALRYRSRVRLHSALMLGTLIGLAPPIFSRLFNAYIPGIGIEGLDTMHRFHYSVQLSLVASLLVALLLYVRYRKEGWPWLLAAGIIVLGYVLYAVPGQTQAWQNMVAAMSQAHPVVVFLLGFVWGLAACVMGWRQKKQVT